MYNTALCPHESSKQSDTLKNDRNNRSIAAERTDHSYIRKGRSCFSILDKYIRAEQLMELFTLPINFADLTNDFDIVNCRAFKQFSINMESHIILSPSLRFCTVCETNVSERFTFCVDWTMQNTIKSSILE